MSTIGTITTYEIGADLVVEWKIEKFFNLLQTDGSYYFSPQFPFGGERWDFRIFPNGWRLSDSSGHVDLELWKYSSGRSIKQSFSLSLKTVTGEQYKEQNVMKDFHKGMDYHSFKRFVPRSELTRRRSELLPEDVLTVICTMKNSTSAGNTSDFLQQEHLEKRDLPLSKETSLLSLIPAMLQVGKITTTESGADLVVEWKIENVFNLPDTDGAWYFSPVFSFGGEDWCLWIFTSGSSESDSSGHVGVDLWKRCSDRSIKQSFSLSLKTVRGGKYNEQHFSKDFDNYNFFHRFNRFIHRSELSKRRSDLAPDGTLSVICTMKSPTSTGSDTGKDPEHAAVGGSTHRVDVTTQTVEASIQSIEASTQTVEGKCEACASGSSTNPQERKVLHDLKELFLNKEDCDVTIKVEGSEFPAHRAILKVRSPVFASTFRHDMKENATGILVIEDCHPSTFSDFLYFLYCGDVGIISQENVFGLFTLSDKYQVLDLRSKCLEFIKLNLTVDTFCETITLALRHSETELIRLCTEYFKRNVPKIIVTVKWQTFLAENPTESNELFVKSFVPNSS